MNERSSQVLTVTSLLPLVTCADDADDVLRDDVDDDVTTCCGDVISTSSALTAAVSAATAPRSTPSYHTYE